MAYVHGDCVMPNWVSIASKANSTKHIFLTEMAIPLPIQSYIEGCGWGSVALFFFGFEGICSLLMTSSEIIAFVPSIIRWKSNIYTKQVHGRHWNNPQILPLYQWVVIEVPIEAFIRKFYLITIVFYGIIFIYNTLSTSELISHCHNIEGYF